MHASADAPWDVQEETSATTTIQRTLKDTLNNKSPMKGDETDGTEDSNGDDSGGRS